MRTRILSSFLLGLTLVPGLPAFAQEFQDEEMEGSETEGAEVADDEEPPAERGSVRIPPGTGGRESAPGEIHTVVKGDTLWDLSQRYLGSPWYWPKVWSYNPEIANPHWIYPGNMVRFFPAGEEVPSRVEANVGPVPMEMVAEEGDAPEVTEMGEMMSGEEMVSVSGKIGYAPKVGRTVMRQGFVTQRELDEAGRIESSFSEAEMLSFPDTVYVRFKKKADAQVGDRYVVFHTGAEIRHPLTGKKEGYLTEFLGTMRVVSIGDTFVTAQIQDTWDSITRGDLVGPYGENFVERVTQRPNEKEVKGTIVTALVPYLTITGEHHFLVVDRGSAAGVQVGNTFSIIRQADLGGDMYEPHKVQESAKNLPPETIGLCMVTEVKEQSSNCVLVQSLREIVPGDRAVMRVGDAAQPTASR